ncbi:hypothetical protein ONZ51_g5733 [Trametes cubensis]|uniref:Uncharacterized protein n=1 Tax=Trametes cubensis TaxID=1111947 RepID=A0AAD7TVY2_9APHY|nr:hypothetical protein ONZ51_g5733 [Trametes cubensis]
MSTLKLLTIGSRAHILAPSIQQLAFNSGTPPMNDTSSQHSQDPCVRRSKRLYSGNYVLKRTFAHAIAKMSFILIRYHRKDTVPPMNPTSNLAYLTPHTTASSHESRFPVLDPEEEYTPFIDINSM